VCIGFGRLGSQPSYSST